MIVINNKIIPFGNYKAMNFFGIVFTKEKLTNTEYNHEHIHLKQMQEMLWIGFYLQYIIEYLIIWFARFFDSQSTKYHDISFEEEAYHNATNQNYIKERKHYSWLKYIKIGSYGKSKSIK